MLRAGLFADPFYLSRDDAMLGRALITPDEIMTMRPCAQLILLAHAHPVTAYKTAYYRAGELLESAERVENGVPPTPELDQALFHGSSLGGAAVARRVATERVAQLVCSTATVGIRVGTL